MTGKRARCEQNLTFPTPLPFKEGSGVGAPHSGGLRSIGQNLAALATHPNPSLKGRGYLSSPFCRRYPRNRVSLANSHGPPR